jgi:ribosome maturation protein Sdo1
MNNKKNQNKWNNSGYRLINIKKGENNYDILVNSKKYWKFSQKIKQYKKQFSKELDSMEMFQNIGMEFNEIVENPIIYSDIHKNMRASNDELLNGFGTIDPVLICVEILINGTAQISKKERKKKRKLMENKLINFICNRVKNPRNNRPYTRKKILTSLKNIKYHIDLDEAVEDQFDKVITDLRKILPISINSEIKYI